MSGPGHQFPGNFPNNPNAMRSNFGGGPMGANMQNTMTNQLSGVLGTQIPTAGMVGMGTQMGPNYTSNMQNSMGNMPGMPQQSMAVVGSASPNPGMGGIGGISGITSGTTLPTGIPGSGMNPALSTPSLGGIPNPGLPANPISSPTITSTMTAPAAGSNASPANQTSPAVANQTGQAVNQPQKEFNTASLCRFGQETVQDIVSRTQEVFQTLKAIQHPNGTLQGVRSSDEKKAKIQEQLRTIRLLFKRLRLIYEKCNENCQVPGMEYTHIESLIPLKEEYEHKTIDEKKTSEAYKVVCEENKELVEQVSLKNKQLKEVINNLRTIIREINVMLSMRRS